MRDLSSQQLEDCLQIQSIVQRVSLSIRKESLEIVHPTTLSTKLIYATAELRYAERSLLHCRRIDLVSYKYGLLSVFSFYLLLNTKIPGEVVVSLEVGFDIGTQNASHSHFLTVLRLR